jgi:uncharacterized protein
VKITCDPAKRDLTLAERGLDFADAAVVFAGPTYDWIDQRKDYGEARHITVGYLRSRVVVVVWTPHGETRHIISMRHCHAKEQRRYAERFR